MSREEALARCVASDWRRCKGCPTHYADDGDPCFNQGTCALMNAKPSEPVVLGENTLAEEQPKTVLLPSGSILDDKAPVGEHASKAATYDSGKAPLAWVPWAALTAMSEVQAYGHKKYGDFNNYRKGMEVSRNLSCAMRHIRDFMEGQDLDHESGQPALAHAMCRIAFVLQNLADGVAIDDRYKGGK